MPHTPDTTANRGARAGIPQTRGWPVLGCLPGLVRDPFGFLTRAGETHGDLYRLDLGLTHVVVLGHPRHAQHVLVDHAENYGKGGSFWNALRGIFGNGLVVSEGDFWRRQRRMMQPHFHRQRLANLTSLMVGAIDESLAAWADVDPGQPFDLMPAFSRLTMKVTTRALFGEGLSASAMREVSESLAYIADYVFRAVVVDALPGWLPVPGRLRFERAIAQIDRTIYQIIAAGRAKTSPESHLLAVLLDAVDDESGERMTDRQLRDEVTTLFLAGYETTSLALAWAFEFLARQPALQRKLQDEVDRVLGERLPTFADLPQLPYTRMVFQETLRLRPSAWQLPRVALKDDEIDGYRIPAGTTVVNFIYAMQRHPAHWPDPERFDPERFTSERTEKRHKLAYMPFGAGQRLCIGKDFALMEGPLALAMVAQRYQLVPASGRAAEPQLTTTLRAKGGVQVRVSKRPPAIRRDARVNA